MHRPKELVLVQLSVEPTELLAVEAGPRLTWEKLTVPADTAHNKRFLPFPFLQLTGAGTGLY